MDQKFNLFKGVFGASDEVLGSIESGVDFEKRIAAIYQTCRSEEEINEAFDALQNEMDENIQYNLRDTRQKLLENFDEEVHAKLKANLRESEAFLTTYEKWLWETTRFFLGTDADFSHSGQEYSFTLKRNPFREEEIHPGPYRIGKNIEGAHVYRPGHPLARRILGEVKKQKLKEKELVFDCSNNLVRISVLKPLVGKKGMMKISSYTVDALEAEDYVIVSALDDEGNIIEQSIAEKMFSLSAEMIGETVLAGEDKERLEQCEKDSISRITTQIAERNSSFFDDEVDKLDKWSEDIKRSLEIELKQLDQEIKAKKTESKKLLLLEEKVKAQRQIKEFEKKRKEKRRRLFEEQDNVEERKETLINSVETRLKQKVKVEELFRIKWRVV